MKRIHHFKFWMKCKHYLPKKKKKSVSRFTYIFLEAREGEKGKKKLREGERKGGKEKDQ